MASPEERLITIPDERVAKLVIFGGGAVVAEYYLPALAILGRLGAVTVVEANPAAITALSRRFPEASYEVSEYAPALDERNAWSTTSAAIIALPNALHVAASRLALEHGFHVLCEKPLALRTADCALLGELAVSRQRLLKVAMSRRYLPSLMAVTELLRCEELGVPLRIEVLDCAPFLWRPQSFSFFEPAAGGMLADMGVHYLDYLGTLVGPLEPVFYEDDSRGGVESALTYDLRAGDVPIHMRLSRLDAWGGELTIECEKGTIRVRKADETEALVKPAAGGKPRRVLLQRPFTDDRWPLNFQGSFCEMLADLDRALRGQPSRLADIQDAEATTGLIEWAYERRKTSGRRRRGQAAAVGADWLITGATGFIGGHLLEHLHTRKQGAIRVAARSPGSCANVARYPVQIVPADLQSREQAEAAVRGARVVFHLAYGRDGPNPWDVTVRGTQNVVNAAIACGVEAVVVLSTMYVFGFPTDVEMVDENCPYRPYGGEYGHSKANMERWCLKRVEKSAKTRVVVLDPTCVFGPRGGAYTTLPVELARRRQFCWIDGGAGLCNYTYVENLVDAIILASETTAANGKRFIITDGAISWHDFLAPFLAPLQLDIPAYTRAELDSMWGGEPRFSVADAMRAIIRCPEVRVVLKRSKLLANFQKIISRSGWRGFVDGAVSQDPFAGVTVTRETEPRPPRWLPEIYNANAVRFSAQRARDTLGWSPRIPIETAREKTLSWLRDTGFYRDAQLSAG